MTLQIPRVAPEKHHKFWDTFLEHLSVMPVLVYIKVFSELSEIDSLNLYRELSNRNNIEFAIPSLNKYQILSPKWQAEALDRC